MLTPRTEPLSLEALTQPYIRTCIYGGTGVGKTILAGSSQKMRTFLFDVDDGAISLLAYLRRTAQRTDLVKVWPVTDFASFQAGFQYLAQRVNQYQLVVVDTSSELQQVMLDEVRRQAKVQVASQREWGIVFTMMEEAMRYFRHMPLHVIWTAHEMEREDPYYGRVVYRPAFQGQFGGWSYAKHFSEIWRYCLFETQAKAEAPQQKPAVEVSRVLSCQRTQFSHGKDRSMGLAEFEPPYLDYLFDKMIYSIMTNNVNLNKEEETNGNS
jgi:hypothetical protein